MRITAKDLASCVLCDDSGEIINDRHILSENDFLPLTD